MSLGEILFEFVKPSSAILIVLAFGLGFLVINRRIAVICLGAGATAFLIVGILPIGAAALRPLENRFPPVPISSPPDGVILLGGYADWTRISTARDLPLGDSAERLTAAASLALRYPSARLIISGSPLPSGSASSAELTADLLSEFGVASARMILDGQSLSTWDNARYSLKAAQPLSGEIYVLVTSAFHMPRAMATFRAAGWPRLIPWPVDYRVPEEGVWRVPPDAPAGPLSLTDRAAREWLSLLVYRALGRITTLWPGPDRDLG